MGDSKILPCEWMDKNCDRMETAVGLRFKRRQQWPVSLNTDI